MYIEKPKLRKSFEYWNYSEVIDYIHAVYPSIDPDEFWDEILDSHGDEITNGCYLTLQVRKTIGYNVTRSDRYWTVMELICRELDISSSHATFYVDW